MAPSNENLKPDLASVDPESGIHWYDIRALGIEGQGWTDVDRTYARLPARAEALVRPAVWELAQHSAGLCVRFLTDSTAIDVRWTLSTDQLATADMPASGVSGIDLYIKDQERPQHALYHWTGTGVPDNISDNEKQLVSGLSGEQHEFIMYLPLYNGVESVEIGITPAATLATAPPRTTKPIVIYGTSIVHGGCCSRPGMTYPAIIGRRLDAPVINLGFSGNAQAEPELANLLTELDPSMFVLDYCPNVTSQGVRERTEPFVTTIRQAHPETPIVIVENIVYQKHLYVDADRLSGSDKNDELRAAYERLRASGMRGLLYVPGDQLLGDDGEGTVDGVHPTDLGFMRMAQTIGPVLESLL